MEVASLKLPVASWLVIELQLRWLHSAVPVIIDDETLLWRDQRTTNRKIHITKKVHRLSVIIGTRISTSRCRCRVFGWRWRWSWSWRWRWLLSPRSEFLSAVRRTKRGFSQTSVNLPSSLLLLLSFSRSLSPSVSSWTASISAGHSQHLRTAHHLSSTEVGPSLSFSFISSRLQLQLQF